MNTFSAGSSIRAGWETFKKRPGIFIGASALAIIILWLISFLNATTIHMPVVFGIGRVVVILLSVLVDMGLINFFLNASRDPMQAKISDLWHPEPYLSYLGATLLVGILTLIGLILIIIPGLILALMWLFFKFLIVDKNLGPIQAMKERARLTKGHRLELLLLVLFAIVVNIIGAILFLVGLFFTVPITLLVMTSAYRALEKGGAPTVLIV
jgi:uncharacterized membrane protein